MIACLSGGSLGPEDGLIDFSRPHTSIRPHVPSFPSQQPLLHYSIAYLLHWSLILSVSYLFHTITVSLIFMLLCHTPPPPQALHNNWCHQIRFLPELNAVATCCASDQTSMVLTTVPHSQKAKIQYVPPALHTVHAPS